jgi:hypothetical protein
VLNNTASDTNQPDAVQGLRCSDASDNVVMGDMDVDDFLAVAFCFEPDGAIAADESVVLDADISVRLQDASGYSDAAPVLPLGEGGPRTPPAR